MGLSIFRQRGGRSKVLTKGALELSIGLDFLIEEFPGGGWKSANPEFFSVEVQFDLVSFFPFWGEGIVLIGEEVDPLIGRADPASGGCRQFFDVGAVDQDVGLAEQFAVVDIVGVF